MSEDIPSLARKQTALVEILNNIVERGAQFVMYASALGAIALIPSANAPMEFIAANLGVNLLSGIIERVARGEKIPKSKLKQEIETAIQASKLDELLKKEDFSRALAQLLRNQDKIFFTTKSNEYELRRLSEQMTELLHLQRVQQSSSFPNAPSGNITHFYVLSQTNTFIEDAKNKVRELWSRAELIEKYYPLRAIDLYREALNVANAAIASENATGASALDELYILRTQVQRRYNETRERHEIPLSKRTGDELVSVVVYFSDLAEQDPTTPVTYFSSAEDGARAVEMEVSRALEVAKQRLLSFWRDKVHEYAGHARPLLVAHRPREAMAALTRYESLPGLHDERIGLSLPQSLQIVIQGVSEQIQIELESLKSAERKVQLARLEKNPTQAKRLLDAAKEDYPYLPDLQRLDEDIQSMNRSDIK